MVEPIAQYNIFMKDKNMNIETETIYKQTVKRCPMFKCMYYDVHARCEKIIDIKTNSDT